MNNIMTIIIDVLRCAYTFNHDELKAYPGQLQAMMHGAVLSSAFLANLSFSLTRALGFVCFGINSPRLIKCNISQTIESCFIRVDNDTYKTIAKTFTKGDSHSNKGGV